MNSFTGEGNLSEIKTCFLKLKVLLSRMNGYFYQCVLTGDRKVHRKEAKEFIGKNTFEELLREYGEEKFTIWLIKFSTKNSWAMANKPTDNEFDQVCHSGDIELVKSLLLRGGGLVNYGLHLACLDGYPKLVDFLISCGADDWGRGLYGACQGNNLELINLMLSNGAHENSGLEGACRGGHLEIVQLLISDGANNWNWGLLGACQSGHMELIKLMISYGADEWDGGLRKACENNHLSTIRLMITNGAKYCGNCGKSMPHHLERNY